MEATNVSVNSEQHKQTVSANCCNGTPRPASDGNSAHTTQPQSSSVVIQKTKDGYGVS